MTSFCKKHTLNFLLNFALYVNALLHMNQDSFDFVVCKWYLVLIFQHDESVLETTVITEHCIHLL